jgi:hypothetical protein
MQIALRAKPTVSEQFSPLFSAWSGAAAENDKNVNEPTRHWSRVFGKLNLTKLYSFKNVV